MCWATTTNWKTIGAACGSARRRPCVRLASRASVPLRIARPFGYAAEGLGMRVRTQPNFGVHRVAACAAILLGAVPRLPAPEMALIVMTTALVLVTEAVNTALEALSDLVSPTYHPLVKRAKDVGA